MRARPASVFCVAYIAWGCILLLGAPQSTYDRFFTGRTMRVDVLHRGGPGGEALSVARVVDDNRWPGSRTHLIDVTNLGDFFFEVVDPPSGQVIYSRGYGSIYGEWRTTPEFRTLDRTFEESVRFPWPRSAVRLVFKRRDRQNTFEAFWNTDIAPPHDAGTSAATPQRSGRVWTIFESGPPSTKVDLLLISDGYSAKDLPKFHADARRLAGRFFSYEPFRTRKSDFNVRALDLPGERSSIGTEFNVFGLARYVLTYHDRALHDVAAAAPYDVVELLVNSAEYGGGGIFNLQSTAAVDNARSEYVFVHELAHNLAALGDEYSGNVTYETQAADRPEPWEPNFTLLRNPQSLKWKSLVDATTPLPTPPEFAGHVGAFEGGGYQSRGVFRPEYECIMGTSRPGVGFCRVCQQAISRVIDTYVE